MKKVVAITLGVIFLGSTIGFLLFSWVMFSYNSMVAEQEFVKQKWSQVENVYQRRLDLIPNLVETVKGYAKHESKTLKEVIEARAKATSITIDTSKATPEQLAKYQESQGMLAMALGKLMVITEQYPNLKADVNFRDLQAQLEGTENRIAVERREFTLVVQRFNSGIKSFPRNILASKYGFKEYPYFEAEKGAERAPKVKFD